MLYKDKIPEMPPHRIMKKSKEVVEERIVAFARYMNKISENINVFADDDIVRFIRLEKEIPHLMSNLKDQFETQRLEKMSAY